MACNSSRGSSSSSLCSYLPDSWATIFMSLLCAALLSSLLYSAPLFFLLSSPLSSLLSSWLCSSSALGSLNANKLVFLCFLLNWPQVVAELRPPMYDLHLPQVGVSSTLSLSFSLVIYRQLLLLVQTIIHAQLQHRLCLPHCLCLCPISDCTNKVLRCEAAAAAMRSASPSLSISLSLLHCSLIDDNILEFLLVFLR